MKTVPSPGRTSSVLPVVAMNHAVNDGSVYLLSSLFPVVLTLFGMSVLQVGILVAAGYLVSVVSQPIVGHWSEREDPRKLLALGIGIISASVFSFIASNGFYSMLTSVIFLRLGASFFHPVGASTISRTYSGKRLDHSMGIMSAFGNLGIFLVFISAAPVYLTLGWKGTFILFAMIGAADVIITLVEFKKQKLASSYEHENVDTNKRPFNFKHDLLGAPSFFLLSAFVSGASFAVILNYANILLVSEAHAHVLYANLAVSGWIAAAVFGAVSTGRWPRVARRIIILCLCFLLSAVSIAFLAVASSNLLIAVPVLVVNGFVLSATYPLTYSELSDWLEQRPEVKGRSFGALFSAQTIGGSALGLVSGYLSDVYGLPSAFLAIGLMMLLGVAGALSWSRRTVNRNS